MSSSPPGEAEAPPKSHPQSEQTQHTVQATEQQLKARAEGVSIEDYLLPRSITLRLAKSVLPPNTAVQKDAVLAIQKAATVFVSYLSSHANEATLKRTVTPADVLNAISELELEGFKPRLEKELDKFTDLKAAKRRPRKSAEGEGKEGGDEGQIGTGGEGEKKEVVVRGAKRVKRDGAGGEEVEEDDRDQEDEGEDVGDGDEVEEHDEDATEEEEDEEEDEEVGEDEDIDRVEDIDRGARDRRMMDPDAAGDETESDDEGPGSQLRGDLGLG